MAGLAANERNEEEKVGERSALMNHKTHKIYMCFADCFFDYQMAVLMLLMVFDRSHCQALYSSLASEWHPWLHAVGGSDGDVGGMR
jgi:hypothetical protein